MRQHHAVLPELRQRLYVLDNRAVSQNSIQRWQYGLIHKPPARVAVIPERVAEMDAEGIEHHVSPDTLAAFKMALRNARS